MAINDLTSHSNPLTKLHDNNNYVNALCGEGSQTYYTHYELLVSRALAARRELKSLVAESSPTAQTTSTVLYLYEGSNNQTAEEQRQTIKF